jgi:hypothetical protein
MENELRIIAGLEPAQLAERAGALMLEVEYWQHVLEDRAKVNTAVRDGTAAVLDATSTAIVLAMLVEPAQVSFVETLLEQLRRAVDALAAVADAEGSTLELAVGRKKALEPVARELQRAAGIEVDDDEPAGQS